MNYKQLLPQYTFSLLEFSLQFYTCILQANILHSFTQISIVYYTCGILEIINNLKLLFLLI